MVKAGEKVDVRDTEYIWCSGIVELKISTMNRYPLLYIHYEVSEQFNFIGHRGGTESMTNTSS